MAKTLLTKEGYAELLNERDTLKNVTLPKVIEELSEARSQGDLSENADYDAARTRQAEINRRLMELDSILANVEIIESAKSKNIVRLGSTVTIYDKTLKDTATYTIVGSVEANPFNNKISNESPLALALMNHKVGEIVTIKVQDPYEVEIKDVK